MTDDSVNSIIPLFGRVMAADFSPLTIITPVGEPIIITIQES